MLEGRHHAALETIPTSSMTAARRARSCPKISMARTASRLAVPCPLNQHFPLHAPLEGDNTAPSVMSSTIRVPLGRRARRQLEEDGARRGARVVGHVAEDAPVDGQRDAVDHGVAQRGEIQPALRRAPPWTRATRRARGRRRRPRPRARPRPGRGRPAPRRPPPPPRRGPTGPSRATRPRRRRRGGLSPRSNRAAIEPSCRAAASKAGAASVARQPAAPATRTPLNGARRGIFARASGRPPSQHEHEQTSDNNDAGRVGGP